MPTDDSSIRYPIRDLLEAVNRKLDRVLEQLAQKADRQRVHDLTTDVAALAARFTLLERQLPDVTKKQAKQDDQIDSLQTWRARLGGATAVAGVLGAAAVILELNRLFG